MSDEVETTPDKSAVYAWTVGITAHHLGDTMHAPHVGGVHQVNGQASGLVVHMVPTEPYPPERVPGGPTIAKAARSHVLTPLVVVGTADQLLKYLRAHIRRTEEFLKNDPVGSELAEQTAETLARRGLTVTPVVLRKATADEVAAVVVPKG